MSGLTRRILWSFFALLASVASAEEAPVEWGPEKADRAIRKLASQEAAERKAATDTLVTLGDIAERAIRSRLKEQPLDDDLRTRLEDVLTKIDGERLRSLEFKTAHSFRLEHGAVHSIAFDPEGKRLALGSWQGSVEIWDTAAHSRSQIIELGYGYVERVSFSSSGKTLLAEGSFGVALVDLQRGAVTSLGQSDGRHHHSTAAWAHDGRDVLLSTEDGNFILEGPAFTSRESLGIELNVRGRLVLNAHGTEAILGLNTTAMEGIDLAKGTKRQIPIKSGNQSDWCNAVSVFPDDHLLIVWPYGTISWDECVVDGGRSDINAVAISPDGKRICGASSNGKARVWAREGNLIATHDLGDTSGEAVAFSPDGLVIAVATHDGRVLLFSGAGTATLPGTVSTAATAAFSRDGESCAVAGSEILIARRDGTVQRAAVQSERVAPGTHESDFLVGGWDWVAAVDGASGCETKRFKIAGLQGCDDLKTSPGSSAFIFRGTTCRGYRIVETGTEQSWKSFLGPETNRIMIRDTAWSPGGTRVALAGRGNDPELFGVMRICSSEGELLHDERCQFDVWSVAWSPDGRWIVWSDGENLCATNTESFETTKFAVGRSNRIQFLGSRAFLNRNAGKVTLWQTGSWQLVKELDIGVPLATSQDGSRLVVEKDREIRIIDLKR